MSGCISSDEKPSKIVASLAFGRLLGILSRGVGDSLRISACFFSSMEMHLAGSLRPAAFSVLRTLPGFVQGQVMPLFPGQKSYLQSLHFVVHFP